MRRAEVFIMTPTCHQWKPQNRRVKHANLKKVIKAFMTSGSQQKQKQVTAGCDTWKTPGLFPLNAFTGDSEAADLSS